MSERATDYPCFITKEYRRFTEFCTACTRDQYIGLCYGPPGVGKTFSAKTYSAWDQVKTFHRHDVAYRRPTQYVPALLAKQTMLFYTASVANSPARIDAALKHGENTLQNIRYDAAFCQLPSYQQYSDKEYDALRIKNMLENPHVAVSLLIVDESDRLKLPSLEQIRDYYDQKNCGLILIGMPGIEKKLSRYAQLYSRIGFVHEFKALSQEEMFSIINQQLSTLEIDFNPADFVHHEALTTMLQITRGNFRLLHRLFQQIERLMPLNQLKTLTKDVVMAARECLVVGV